MENLSDIQENVRQVFSDYLSEKGHRKTPGVQHIAIATDDIIQTVRKLRSKGASIYFKTNGDKKHTIEVFTTRPKS